MNSLMLIAKVGGYEAARRILDHLEFELKPMGFADFTVTLDNGFSFQSSALYKAYFSPNFGYENGIVLGNLSKRSRLILSNEYGYLGYYWGYKSFRPAEINTIQDLNDLKSHAIKCGAKMDWSTYQWVLSNFEIITESCKNPL